MRPPSSGRNAGFRPAAAGIVRRALAPAIAAALGATPAAALEAPPCTARQLFISTTDWQPPLDRPVTFRAGETSLRDALDRLAATARLRFSYSSDMLQLQRTVCVAVESSPVGAVLERLLGNTVELIVAGDDHVILAPRPQLQPKPSMIVAPVVLDRIVVTGNASGASQRGLPLALDVIDGRELERRRVFTMSSALGGSVPGVWLWGQSPGSLLLRFGSIRGASSFGLSYPKTFIDGIEVANPLLLTRLVPEAVETIELIRGPHGAALYGADAISGVMNITTRLDQPQGGEPRSSLQMQGGVLGGDYSAGTPITTTSVGVLNAGDGNRSLRLSVEAGGDGGWIPGAYARRLTLAGSARAVAEKSILTGTLRFFGQQARLPISPILAETAFTDTQVLRLNALRDHQTVMQYTAGATVKLLPNDRWRHTITGGVDGYALDGILDDGAPIPSATDSALVAARGNATRASVRWNSMVRLLPESRNAADLTIAADFSVLRQETSTLARVGPNGGPGSQPPPADFTRWRNTMGTSVIGNASLIPERVFVNAGLRAERASGSLGVVYLPMAGAALIPVSGPVTVKLRAAWGKGIRYPETSIRESLHGRLRDGLAALLLDPEVQSGVEAGFDLIWDRGVSLTLTRFDQTASGLIQRVAIPGDTSSGAGPRERVRYQLQNVGAIANDGWELQGTLARGPVSLTGALSFVDSRVRRLANGYGGDLREGDRMLEVPARTISVSAAWTGAPWHASVTLWRAEDWINYDRRQLAYDFATDTAAAPGSWTGAALRNYWRTYTSTTQLSAAVSYPFGRLTLTLLGDNLLDTQTGEPDNITVLPGRTFSLAIRGAF